MSKVHKKHRVRVTSVPLTDIRPVPNFRGYYASRAGRLFCIIEMTPYRHNDGYWRVGIKDAGKLRRPGIHQLVCLAFHGVPRGVKEVRHLNGDRDCNAASNLRWGTRHENSMDAVRHGTFLGHGCKLNREDVADIRRRLSTGKETVTKVAFDYPQVCRVTIRKLTFLRVYGPVVVAKKYTNDWCGTSGRCDTVPLRRLRKVPGYVGIFASPDGRVFSVGELTRQVDRGFWYYNTALGPLGIARAVWTAFKGTARFKVRWFFKDGDSCNFNLSNLRQRPPRGVVRDYVRGVC